MSSKLIPRNPADCMVIRDLLPGITTLAVPFARFGHIKVGGRATLVKLQTGTLAVFSPVALTPNVRAKIDSLTSSHPAPVSYLIAPDMEHHIFLSAWATAYPSVHIIGPSGLPEKRREQSNSDPLITDLEFKTVFSRENKSQISIDAVFDAEFEYEYVDAHINHELVFFHRPTRTLIEADLLFNLPATEQYSRTSIDASSGLWTRLFASLQNTRGEAWGQKRMLWYAIAKDHASFSASTRRIAAWDFVNLVPCHGDSVLGEAKGVFKKVFQWFLIGSGSRSETE